MYKLIIIFLFKVVKLTSSFSIFLKSSSIEPFVVNGTDADILNFPWVVSIRWRGIHYCGGSILNENYVLTAGHCSDDPKLVTVHYGTDLLDDPNYIVGCEHWIVHEHYNMTALENDIALLKTNQAFIFGQNAQPVKMPPPYYEVPGSWKTIGTLVGFGLDKVS